MVSWGHLWCASAKQRPVPFLEPVLKGGWETWQARKELLLSCLATCQRHTGALSRVLPVAVYAVLSSCPLALPSHYWSPCEVVVSHPPATFVGLLLSGRVHIIKTLVGTWRKWFLGNEVFLPETADMLPLCSILFLFRTSPIYLQNIDSHLHQKAVCFLTPEHILNPLIYILSSMYGTYILSVSPFLSVCLSLSLPTPSLSLPHLKFLK